MVDRLRAGIYARVSSAKQRDAHTIDSQLHVLTLFVRAQGWDLAETYVDDGRSAKTGLLELRDGFAKLMRDAEAGRFDVIVVLDVNRMTRTGSIEERAQILGPFQRLGIQIATPSGGILDLRSFLGEFWVTVQALVAAEENRKKSEAVKAGKLRAIAEGKKPAGPTPYGYRYDRETGAWTIFDLEADIVIEIFRRCAAGETGEAIAADLCARGVPRPHGGEWTRERIYATLRQSAYRGEWLADKRRKLVVKTPRIVDEELWLSARDRDSSLARRMRGLRKTKHVYLVEGIAACGCCGAPVGIASACSGGRRVPSPARYVCARRRRPDENGRCDAPYWLCSDVDSRIWAVLRETVRVPGRIERAARAAQASAAADGDTWRKDLVSAERRLASLTRAEAAILARFRSGSISEEALDIELAAAKRDREMAKLQVDAARRAQFAAGKKSKRASGIEQLVAELRNRVDSTSPAEQRELVTRLMPRGSVTLTIATIEMRVQLRRPVGSVSAAGCSSLDETIVEIRLVA